MASNCNQKALCGGDWKSDRLSSYKEMTQASCSGAAVILLALCFSCVLTLCEAKPGPYPENKSLVRICGRELINVIKGLCKNCFRGTTVLITKSKHSPLVRARGQ